MDLAVIVLRVAVMDLAVIVFHVAVMVVPSSEMRKLQPDLENVEEQLKPAQLRQIGSITLLYRTPSEISSSSFQNRVLDHYLVA